MSLGAQRETKIMDVLGANAAPMTRRQIGAQTGIDITTAEAALNRLLVAGVVVCEPNPEWRKATAKSCRYVWRIA